MGGAGIVWWYDVTLVKGRQVDGVYYVARWSRHSNMIGRLCHWALLYVYKLGKSE